MGEVRKVIAPKPGARVLCEADRPEHRGRVEPDHERGVPELQKIPLVVYSMPTVPLA